MKNLILLLSTILVFFCSCSKDSEINNGIKSISGQEDIESDEFASGLLENEDFNSVESDLLLGGFDGDLPSKIDFSDRFPPVNSQGNVGTCVSWAVGYYSKTALNAIDLDWDHSDLSEDYNQGSPKDLHYSIPDEGRGPNCHDGAWIHYALDVLVQRGIADLQTEPYQGINTDDCFGGLPENNQIASKNTLDKYRKIDVTVSSIKAYLAQQKPVIFGAKVGTPFQRLSNLSSNFVAFIDDIGTDGGGHAMAICGYDDNRNAFKIINSWGKNWGDQGFLWIDYQTFVGGFCKYAYVPFNKSSNDNPDNPTSNNKPDLIPYNLYDEYNVDGSSDIDRVLYFDVFNNGNATANASKDYRIGYLYYNAFDPNHDYGVILDQYMSDDLGPSGQHGPMSNGYGMSGNYWANVDIPAGSGYSQQMWNSDRTSWAYTMPTINGYYYLAMIVDPTYSLDESDEDNNVFIITAGDGGPIYFENGKGFGMKGEDEVVSRNQSEITNDLLPNPRTIEPKYANTYSASEIQQFVQDQYKNGKISLSPSNTTSGPTKSK